MRIVKVRSVTSFCRVMGELGIHGMREVMVREVTRSGKGSRVVVYEWKKYNRVVVHEGIKG